MEQFIVLILTFNIMELQELKQEELNAIYGGSQASDSLMYLLGVSCKYLYNLAATAGTGDGSYAYCKCGM
jgi:hypothetical protein